MVRSANQRFVRGANNDYRVAGASSRRNAASNGPLQNNTGNDKGFRMMRRSTQALANQETSIGGRRPPVDPCGRHRARHGVTIVIVLALLSVTLALSYAMMRTQVTHDRLQWNFNRSLDAVQAAQAGLSVGLRKMHQSDWEGVGVDATGELGLGMAYRVIFETGDASLETSDPDYSDYAYRVTVTSTGTATDSADPTITSTHKLRAVVQLVPRKMSDAPSNWSHMQDYTVYQWATGRWHEVDLELPMRIEGPVCFQNEIELCEDYPGDADDRPFSGTIDEVAIFGTALTADQVDELHRSATTLANLVRDTSLDPVAWWRLNETVGATSAIDELGNWHGVYDGAVPGKTAIPVIEGTGAAHFDGYNDNIQLGPVDVSGDQITILAWFKADSFDVSDARILSKTTDDSTSSHYWMLSTWKKHRDYRLRFRLRTSSTTTLIADSGDLRAGDWVFAAATYDGSQMKIYKDGVLVGSHNKSGSLATNSDVLASIGNNPPGSPRARLLRDLEAMRVAGLGDLRPLTGPVYTPTSETSAEILSLIQDECGVTVNDIVQQEGEVVSHPGEITAYRLYPGGAEYAVPELENTLEDTRLTADPVTNPLGIFKHEGKLRLDDNTGIQGTIITYGKYNPDLDIRGENVKILPVTLPSLYGDATNFQLPAAIVKDDLHVRDDCQASFKGLAVVWDDFECRSGSEDTAFDFQGKLFVSEFEVHSRESWDESDSWWKELATKFWQQIWTSGGEQYFPEFARQEEDLDPTPKILVRPDSTKPSYHWPDWDQPIFVPHPDDGGLRWDVIRWETVD